MRLTKRTAIASGLTLAAGALAMGILPTAANAASGSSCGWSKGDAYEICVEYTTGTGGGVTALDTSWYSGGLDFHVQLVSPSGATLCNSRTVVNNAGTSVSCTWNSSSIPAGKYCAVNWEYEGEWIAYGEECAQLP
jgi:hypothetical protein